MSMICRRINPHNWKADVMSSIWNSLFITGPYTLNEINRDKKNQRLGNVCNVNVMASSHQVLWCGWNKPHIWRNFHHWHSMSESLINSTAMRNEAYVSFHRFQSDDKLFDIHHLLLCQMPYKYAFLHISHTLQ